MTEVRRKPLANYANKVKSHIKNAVSNLGNYYFWFVFPKISSNRKGRVNLTDPILFPLEKKRYQSFLDDLAKDG